MVQVRILARQPLACSSAAERPRDMGEVDRFDPVQSNQTPFRGSVAHLDGAPGFDPGGSRFDPCRGFHLHGHASIAQRDRAPVRDAGGARFESSWARSTCRTRSCGQSGCLIRSMPCVRLTLPSPSGRRWWTLANRGARVRIVRRPRRPVVVFRFRGRLISLARLRASRSGGQRGHHFRRVAQPGQRERLGTAWSKVRILPRRLSAWSANR